MYAPFRTNIYCPNVVVAFNILAKFSFLLFCVPRIKIVYIYLKLNKKILKVETRHTVQYIYWFLCLCPACVYLGCMQRQCGGLDPLTWDCAVFQSDSVAIPGITVRDSGFETRKIKYCKVQNDASFMDKGCLHVHNTKTTSGLEKLTGKIWRWECWG